MMQTASLTLPDGQQIEYHIRHSRRAKYMRMQISQEKGIVVTQPVGVCEHVLADWVASKADWIATQLDKVTSHPKQSAPTEQELELPTQIELTALGTTLAIEYKATTSPEIRVDYTQADKLILWGATHQKGFCAYVLQQWLKSYGKVYLGIELLQASKETGFRYNNFRVKGQKTRWGSCSSKGNINLNYKLMLMPREWMRYTLIHELAHTVELNHSKRFWALVEQHVPNYKTIHEEMKRAHEVLPDWVNYELKV